MSQARTFSVVLGSLLAVAGVALDNRLLVWAAMIVLSVALALRFWSRRRSRNRPPEA